MPRRKRIGTGLLEAALEGLEARRAEIERNIAEVKRLLRSAGPTPAKAAVPVTVGRRRRMSEAAKKRIAEAQRRRWAAFRASARKRGSAEK